MSRVFTRVPPIIAKDGTSGIATASTGGAVGLFGQAFSPQGVAGLFANVAGGDIIRGGVNQPEITVFRVVKEQFLRMADLGPLEPTLQSPWQSTEARNITPPAICW